MAIDLVIYTHINDLVLTQKLIFIHSTYKRPQNLVMKVDVKLKILHKKDQFLCYLMVDRCNLSICKIVNPLLYAHFLQTF